MVDVRELRRIASLMAEQGLREVEIERDGARVRLVRDAAGVGAAPTVGVTAPSAPPAEPGGPRAITSPMVGTFHRAPAPDAAPFVEVGDVVERGQVLCLLEAMKMMNEIEAEFRGRVREILIENGRGVEYGEALFLIEPV